MADYDPGVYAVVINRASGQQQVFMTSITGYYQVFPGDKVLWDERLHGNIYALDIALNELYEIIYSQEMYDYEGRMFKLFLNGRPYLHWEWDFIPAHAAWLYANWKKTIEVWKMKVYLSIVYPTEYATINSTIEATYATTPLNKVRWEEKEFMTWGGVIHDFIQAGIGLTDFQMYELYIDSGYIMVNYNDINENDLIT